MSPSPAVRPPKQDRSRQTLDRIVRSSLELIGEQGVEATTVKQIVRRARSSVGSFYGRFRGKEELLVYLEERLWGDALERWESALESGAWDDLTLPELVRKVVGLVLEAYRVGTRQRAVLAARNPNRGGADPAREFHVSLRRGLRHHLLSRGRDITHPHPSLAVDVALRVLVGAVRELEEDAALQGALPGVDDDRLVDELTRLVLAYLGGDAAALDEHGGPMDFFDVWG